MKNEFIQHYAHTWRLLAALVNDFDEETWLHTGRGVILPVRLAFHLLKSVTYYIEDATPVLLASGKPFDGEWETAQVADWPTQNDILAGIAALQPKVEAWLSAMDLGAENQKFPWAGETQGGVVLFLLRHTLYHIGELNALLEETRNGKATDHFVKTL